MKICVIVLLVALSACSSACADVFERCAMALLLPEGSAATAVHTWEKEFQKTSTPMSDDCRGDLMELMIEASIERLDNHVSFAEAAKVIKRYWTAEESRQIANFLMGKLGVKYIILVNRITIGVDPTPEARQHWVDTTFTPDEQREVDAFLLSAGGLALQKHIAVIQEEMEANGRPHLKASAAILSAYGPRIDAIMKKYGHQPIR